MSQSKEKTVESGEIGWEYLVGVEIGEGFLYFQCLLCDSKLENIEEAKTHVNSSAHQLKFLVSCLLHFFNKLF